MGCNCKETAKNAKKYTDDETIVKLYGFNKFRFIIRKIITIVLVILVFIIAVPFAIIAGIVKIFKGEKISINITKIIKLFNVKQ